MIYKSCIYSPDGNLVGELEDADDLIGWLLWIATEKVSGYYIISGRSRLDIDSDGKLQEA